MSIFNKQGDEFTHVVYVPRDPNTSPTYSHTFPVKVGNHVEDRWATKVRPIADMTKVLGATGLKRYKDYMVQFENRQYEYWFKEDVDAAMFKLSSAGVVQKMGLPGAKFKIKCPCCSAIYDKTDIEWV
jgi:L-rhamnose mutarotase